MDKKIIVITSIIFFCLGLGGGMFLQKVVFTEEKDMNDTYAAGWAAAKQKLYSSDTYESLDKNVAIKSISGSVQSINNNQIIVKIRSIDPLSEDDLRERIVMVDNNTTITAFVKKTREQIQEEINSAMENGGLQASPDSPNGGIKEFDYVNSSINEIDIGKQIVVNTDENIRDKKSFVAKEILFGK